MKKLAKFSYWTSEEIKKLFNYVSEQKEKFLTLSNIFESYANISGRKPNSVRNYYYSQLNDFKNNPSLLQKLEIDLSKHNKQTFKHFSLTESKELKEKINNLIKSGHSVRSACLELAKNDPKVMMRLQNKYQLLKNNKEKTNILQFPKKSSANTKQPITDTDINNLFLGLVKVIKRSVQEQTNQELISECEWANNTLRKTLVNLTTKEHEIKSLNLQNTILSQKVIDLQNEIYNLCQKNREK